MTDNSADNKPVNADPKADPKADVAHARKSEWGAAPSLSDGVAKKDQPALFDGPALQKHDPFADEARKRGMPLPALIGIVVVVVAGIAVAIWVATRTPDPVANNAPKSDNATAVSTGSSYLDGLRQRAPLIGVGVISGLDTPLTPEQQERIKAEEERLAALERLAREEQRPGRNEAGKRALAAYRAILDGWKQQRPREKPLGGSGDNGDSGDSGEGTDSVESDLVATPWPVGLAPESAVLIDGVLACPSAYREAYVALEQLVDPDAGHDEVQAFDTAVYDDVVKAAEAFKSAIERARLEQLTVRLPARANDLLDAQQPKAALSVYSFETFSPALLWPDDEPEYFKEYVFPQLAAQYVLPRIVAAHFDPIVEPMLAGPSPQYGELAGTVVLNDELSLIVTDEWNEHLEEWPYMVEDAIEVYRNGLLSRARQDYLNRLASVGRRVADVDEKTVEQLDALADTVRTTFRPVIEDWGLSSLAREAAKQRDLLLEQIAVARARKAGDGE